MRRATSLISSTLLLAVLGLVSDQAALRQAQPMPNSPTSAHLVSAPLSDPHHPFEPETSTARQLLEERQRLTVAQYQDLHALASAMHQYDLANWR